MTSKLSVEAFRRWFFIVAIVIVTLVMVGGVTRLTHSGLSMVKWQPIYGILPPMSHAQWESVFDAYKQFPEYQQLRVGMTLFEFKKLFFWEYLHRVLARLLGLVIILPYLFFLIRKQLTPYMIRKGLVMCLLVLVQGFVGWYMVKSGLVNRPDVSHFRLAMHLSLAFFMFEYCLWARWEIEDRDGDDVHVGFVPGLSSGIGLLSLVILQLIYGAFVAGLDGGFGYNTFPKMNGYWIPPTASSMIPFWVNFVSNPVTVQWVHRVLAFWLIIRTWLLGVLVFRSQNIILKRAFYLLCLALAVQITLGILTLVYIVLLPLAVLHQLGGLAVLTSAVYFVFQLICIRGERES